MNIRLRFLALLLLKTQFIWASINLTYYRSLSEDAQYTFADDYLRTHWSDFFDEKKKVDVLANYELMRSEAKSPRMTCLFKLFWHRNQLMGERWKGNGEATLTDLQSIIEYAHNNNLCIEKSICQLEWCVAVLEHNGKMSQRTRRILIYDAALQAFEHLKKQPIAALHKFHDCAYDIDLHLWWMCMYFFRIEEYELARQIALLGEKVVHPKLTVKPGLGYAFYRWQFLNDLGSCHLRLGKFPEATFWYQKAYAFGLSSGSTVQASVSYGNLGVVLSKQGKYAAAIPFLERTIQDLRQGYDQQSEFNALAPLSEVYLHLKQYDKAYPALVRSIALYSLIYANVNSTDSVDIIPLFAGLGEVFQHRGDFKKALFYSQLANRLEVKKRALDDSRLYRQKQEKLEAESYRANLNKMANDRKQAVVLRNSFIAGLIGILALALAYIRNQRERRRKVEEKLTQILQQVRDRSERIDRLQQEHISDFQSESADPLTSYSELLKSVILTETDWEQFQQLFNQIHPKFLDRLRRNHPTLTPAETRLICLSRLSLSTKEMAYMLGVSADTIFKTRYRIRKKVNLPEGMDISEAFAEL